jgi:hypothetical protein
VTLRLTDFGPAPTDLHLGSFPLMNEPIESELMRSAMLESLRRHAPDQYGTFQLHVAVELERRGLPVEASAHGGVPTLRRIDERRFREIVWQLINQGVLVQGLNSSNPQWPFLSLTERGEEYVREGGPDVYDPDGYLAGMEATAPLSDVERRYLQQASAAFRADLHDAAAVMLGAAAEHLLLQLGEAIVAADPGAAKVKKALDGPALGLLREIQRYLEPKSKSLPRELRENFETTFLGVANTIRTSRNDGGHPALPHVERDEAFVLLRLFPIYRGWVIGLIPALPV